MARAEGFAPLPRKVFSPVGLCSGEKEKRGCWLVMTSLVSIGHPEMMQEWALALPCSGILTELPGQLPPPVEGCLKSSQRPKPQSPAAFRRRGRQDRAGQISLPAWHRREVRMTLDGAEPSPRAQPEAHRGQGRSFPCLLFVVLFFPCSRLF